MKTNGYVRTTLPLNPLADTLADLHRRFGRGAIMRLDGPPLPCAAIPTGFPALDAALGICGIPRGRITDIYGPESSGKTALCLSIIAQAQRAGGWAAFVDADRALDPAWAVERWGVDPRRLLYASPESSEDALEITREIIRAGADVVIVDSAAALVPRCELGGEMGDVWGNHGLLMSEALRNLAGPVSKSGAALIFTNQMRQNDRSEARLPGPTGGMALRFYASIRIDLRAVMALRSGGDYIGHVAQAIVKKNKVAAPFKRVEFELIYSSSPSSSTWKKSRG